MQPRPPCCLTTEPGSFLLAAPILQEVCAHPSGVPAVPPLGKPHFQLQQLWIHKATLLWLEPSRLIPKITRAGADKSPANASSRLWQAPNQHEHKLRGISEGSFRGGCVLQT